MYDLFYHASNIGNLKELLPLSILHGTDKKVCYLTPFRVYALFYLRDMNINHVTCALSGDGIVSYYEEFPCQMQTIYQGGAGYLYACTNAGQITEQHTKGVWGTATPVAVSTVEYISDVYAEILKAQYAGDVKVICYESLSSEARAGITEKWKNVILKQNFWNDNVQKAKFFSENFPQAWKAAKEEGKLS